MKSGFVLVVAMVLGTCGQSSPGGRSIPRDGAPTPCDRCAAAALVCSSPGKESVTFTRTALDADGCTYTGNGDIKIQCEVPASCSTDPLCSGTCVAG